MKALDIQNLKSDSLNFLGGSLDAEAKMVLPPELAQEGCLSFILKAEQFESVSKKANIIVAAFDAKALVSKLNPQQALFQTSKINLAMTWVLPFFDKKKERFQWNSEIHPSAVIAEDAKIGSACRIGPGVFIGSKVKIGSGSIIGANTVIENNSRIGENCLLHPLVYIGAETQMGDRCEIHPQVSIGADGFGFATDKTGQQRKIPQVGKVILGDDVEVGANSTIDRATMTATYIHSGTKFDKHCHVAHNCEIGANSLIAGGFFVAGSSKIGANFMAGGTAVVTDHIQITDNVMLAGRAVVTKDISTSGAYGGYPLEPLKDSLKTIANLAHLTTMRKQLKKILEKLGLNEI